MAVYIVLPGSNLKMLETNVKTTADLMTIALNAEREAIRRYSHLAEKMHEDRYRACMKAATSRLLPCLSA